MEVTSSAVIIPHPAQEIDLTEDAADPAPAAVPAPAAAPPPPAPVPVIKREATVAAAMDPDIYCGVPPIPAGWCQPDFAAPVPSLPPVPPPTPEPLISIAELASALGVALLSGIVLGGTVSYLLSKPKAVHAAA